MNHQQYIVPEGETPFVLNSSFPAETVVAAVSRATGVAALIAAAGLIIVILI